MKYARNKSYMYGILHEIYSFLSLELSSIIIVLFIVIDSYA